MSRTKIPSKLKVAILDRDEKKCLWCGRSSVDGIELHIDHVLPETFKGKTTYENLGTLCNECNLGKGSDYFGSYLLTTLIKIPNLFDLMEEMDLETNIHPETGTPHDGDWYKFCLTIYVLEKNRFVPFKIKSHYIIPSIYRLDTGPDTEIKTVIRKEDAIRDLKNKVKDFLFKQRGYLELKAGKIVFISESQTWKKPSFHASPE